MAILVALVRRLSVMLALSTLVAACSFATASKIDFKTTQSGALMTRLRHVHGGAERFRRFAGVQFTYTAADAKGNVFRRDLAFRFDDFEHVWFAGDPEASLLAGPAEEADSDAHHTRATRSSQLRPSSRTLHGEVFATPVASSSHATPADFDFALRSIRFLLEPGLLSSFGRWTFRSLMAPWHVTTVPRVELEPVERSLPFGPYLLIENEASGLLHEVVYSGSHPFVVGSVHRVRYDDYVVQDGFHIAMRRVHTRVRSQAERRQRDPFRPEIGGNDPVVLEETLSNLRWLSASEADAVCPLPTEEEHDVESEPLPEERAGQR